MALKLNQRSFYSWNHIFASVLNPYPWASVPLISPLSVSIFITLGIKYSECVYLRKLVRTDVHDAV